MKKEIEHLTEEKRQLRDTLNKLDANYRIAYRDSGIHEAKIKDLEQQLEQRSTFEHQIIQKLEDVSEKYRLQNMLLKDADLLNLELKKDNEQLMEKL